MSAILAGLLAFMTSLTGLIASVWFIFQIHDSIENAKHRKDLNKDKRKDLHIQYITNYDLLISDIEENGKVTNDEAVIKLLAMIDQSGKDNFNALKAQFISKSVLIKQTKFITNIDKDFNLNKTLKFSTVAKHNPKWGLSKIDSKEASILLILTVSYLFTEHLSLMKYDDKYEPYISFLRNMDKLHKKDLFKLFGTSLIKKEKIEA